MGAGEAKELFSEIQNTVKFSFERGCVGTAGGRGRGAERARFVDFLSAHWKFPGEKGTDPSPGHSPRGRAPRPGLERRRGIRNKSINKTVFLGDAF